ncbi:MAG: hypothetical protein FWC01_06060 [Treponema sp.]|nr:hypothetical protein [Treponema sp.]MCL2237420.1 hypothetical protein [Treponema sp.]
MKNFIFILTLFAIIVSPVFSQEEELSAISRINPRVLTAGEQFTLTITVNYPSAEYVRVITPPMPQTLTVDRYIVFSRIVNSENVTVIEFRFTASSPGRIALDFFTIVTPAGIIETNPYVFNIYSAESNYFIPRLFWEGTPQTAVPGERTTLTLRSNDWNAQLPLPSFFMPPVPQGVILSVAPLSPQERESGIVAKYTLIPLAAGQFRLPARILQYENTRFEIPALFIRIN